MIEYILKFTNHPVMVIINTLSTICFAIASLIWFYKILKKQLKQFKISSKLRLLLITLLFIFCGLISPVLILMKSFSDWSGVYFWISQVLSWYVLYAFVAISYVVIKVEIGLKHLKS
jgi:hypothetical protein